MQHYPLLLNCCFIASVPKLWNDLPLKIRMAKSVDLLWVTRGAHNPSLQVVIMHTSHVCSQHWFGLPLRMNGMYIICVWDFCHS